MIFIYHICYLIHFADKHDIRLGWHIGDNAVTSSMRIAQVFPDLVGKKARALWKVYGGMLKYVINYALYFVH